MLRWANENDVKFAFSLIGQWIESRSLILQRIAIRDMAGCPSLTPEDKVASAISNWLVEATEPAVRPLCEQLGRIGSPRLGVSRSIDLRLMINAVTVSYVSIGTKSPSHSIERQTCCIAVRVLDDGLRCQLDESRALHAPAPPPSEIRRITILTVYSSAHFFLASIHFSMPHAPFDSLNRAP